MLAIRKEDIAPLLGLMAFCAMLRTPFIGTLISANLDSYANFRLAYDVMLILLGLVLLFKVAERALALLGSRKQLALALLGLMASLGAGIINIESHLGSTGGTTSEALCLIGVFAIAIGFVSLAIAGFERLATYPRDRIAVLVLEAFVLSHVFFVFDMLPRELAAWASLLYPAIASGVLLYLLKHDSQAAGNPADPAGMATHHGDYFKRLRIFALVLIVVEVVCGALLRSRWALGGVSYDPTFNTAITYVVSAGIGIVFLVIAKKAKSAAEEALIIGGLGLVGFTVAALLFSMLPVSVLAPFVTGLYSALLVFVLALLILWCADGDHPSSRAAGVFLVLYGSVSSITSTVVPAVLQFQGLMPDEHLAPMGVVAGLVISLGVGAVLFFMVVVHRDSYLKALLELSSFAQPQLGVSSVAASGALSFVSTVAAPGGSAFTPSPSAPNQTAFVQSDQLGGGVSRKTSQAQELSARELHDLAMERVAASYGLTPRERQTASLIAQGFSFKRVAEELCVTPGTIQGYSKSIYRKMSVHKKDELIEIVNHAKHSL